MNLVLVSGAGAVGKLAVGQRLAERTGYGFMHNHVAVEPVLEVLHRFDRWAVSEIRNILLASYFSNNPEANGFIFTIMVDYGSVDDFLYLDNLINFVKGCISPTKLDFYYIELDADLSVRLERNKSELRLERKPSKRNIELSEERLRGEEIRRLVSYPGEVEKIYPNYLRVINDNLSVDEQVDIILNKFRF